MLRKQHGIKRLSCQTEHNHPWDKVQESNSKRSQKGLCDAMWIGLVRMGSQGVGAEGQGAAPSGVWSLRFFHARSTYWNALHHLETLESGALLQSFGVLQHCLAASCFEVPLISTVTANPDMDHSAMTSPLLIFLLAQIMKSSNTQHRVSGSCSILSSIDGT